ncbi:MAG: cobalt transporter [Eubacterium sp.]|nr:cobalt transporter [Eubacterium sp.]
MHILRDENGNLIPHGGHDHHAHEEAAASCDNACASCDPEGGKCKDQTFALLSYMVQHNAQHAAEADKMADGLEKQGLTEAAEQIRKGVTEYQKGNMYLNVALTLYKEQLKERAAAADTKKE